MQEIAFDMAAALVEAADPEIPEEVAPIAAQMSPRSRAALPYMLDLWRRLKFADLRPFAEEQLKTVDRGAEDLDIVAPFTASGAVLDIGCGWGSFTARLQRAGYAVTAADYVFEHAVVTKFVTPEARVFQADARDLGGLADQSFDQVFMKDLIEHVGDLRQPSGPSGANLAHQLRAMREAARVAKLGGYVFVSTGNFYSPFDGEVCRWFFHWLPEEARRRTMDACGFSSDRYYLLTWEEISFLFQAAGLAPEVVDLPPRSLWQEPLFARLEAGFGPPAIEPEYKAILADLLAEDPRYAPDWRVQLRKVEAAPGLPVKDLSLALRALGAPGGANVQTLQALAALTKALAAALPRPQPAA